MNESTEMPEKNLLILALGGTIAMVRGTGGGVTPGLGAAELAAAVSGLDSLANIRAETMSRVTSPNLSLQDLRQVAERITSDAANGRIDACIVTQGTDTIEESAFLLDCLLDVAVPVIMTGAMRNPTLPSSDGAGNLLAAARVAVSDWAIANAANLGVMVVMLDEVYSAFDAVKIHPTRVNAFASPQTGPLAQLVEQRLIPMSLPLREWKRTLVASLSRFGHGIDTRRQAEVGLITVGLGDKGALIRAVVNDPDRLGYGGMVLGLMGGGHVPATMAEDVGRLALLMPVVVAGRMGGGPMLRETYEPVGMEIDLFKRGVIHPGRLGPLKARMLLSVLLAAGADNAEITKVFAACE